MATRSKRPLALGALGLVLKFMQVLHPETAGKDRKRGGDLTTWIDYGVSRR